MIRDPVLLQLYARAPAPCRDYYGLTVTENFVILNIWNISHGPHTFPKRFKITLENYSSDKYLQEEIKRLFGRHVHIYVLGLAKQERNLHYLPTKIFLFIVRHLAANDVLHLGQASKIFFELCNTEHVWKIIYRKRMRRRITREDNQMAEQLGWKELLKNKQNIKPSVRQKTNLSTSTKVTISRQQLSKPKLNNAINKNLKPIQVLPKKVKIINNSSNPIQNKEKSNLANQNIHSKNSLSLTSSQLDCNRMKKSEVEKNALINKNNIYKGKGDFTAKTYNNGKEQEFLNNKKDSNKNVPSKNTNGDKQTVPLKNNCKNTKNKKT